MTKKFLDLTGLDYFEGKLDTKYTAAISNAINTALASYSQNLVTIMSSLPASGEEGKLYLIPDSGAGSGVYTIYTWEITDNTTNPATYGFVQGGMASLNITIDTALSTTSTNPIANNAVTVELNKKINDADLVAITTAEIDALFT